MHADELSLNPGDDHAHGHRGHPHESPITMTLPLLILAFPSVLIGLVETPFANYFTEFIHPRLQLGHSILGLPMEKNSTGMSF